MTKQLASVLNFYPPTQTYSTNRNSGHNSDAASHLLVLINESDVSEIGSFLKFLESFRPKVVLDLRVSPRLDFVAGSRARTFRKFDSLAVTYIDVLGHLNVFSRDDFFAIKRLGSAMLATLVNTDDDDDRPVVCLFDDPEILDRCQKLFKHDILTYFQNYPSTNVSWYRSGLLTL